MPPKSSTTCCGSFPTFCKNSKNLADHPARYPATARPAISHPALLLLDREETDYQRPGREDRARGIIELTVLAYCSPIVLVKKKDGTVRFCSYHRFNTLTTSDDTPMHAIVEVLGKLGNANVFSTIDLKSEYWQIPVDEPSRYLT